MPARLNKKEARAIAQKNWQGFAFPDSSLERLLSICLKFDRVIAYYPAAGEAKIEPFLEKCPLPLFLPLIEGDTLRFRLHKEPGRVAGSLRKGQFGLLEPDSGAFLLEVTRRDLLLLPALAASASGFRLGRGGGFYDKSREFLAGAPRLALLPESCTRLDFVVEEHDIHLDLAITENDLIVYRSWT